MMTPYTTHPASLCSVLGRELLKEVCLTNSRSSFFQTLSRLLKEHFIYDRLCINLYDSNSEMLTYFTAAEGTVINSLSPVRKAEKVTVAGHVIATRKPVVITDIAEHFAQSSLHPMAEAGLSTTMAFPLILNDHILGTLHCSFAEKPNNLYPLMELLLELCPYVAVCLGSILATEQLEDGVTINPLDANSLDSGYENLIYTSGVMREFMNRILKIAKMDIPVLLLGETGTGKTHLAQYIHRNSKRKKRSFVKVNCPALAQPLFESELFGHSKGAFTGAATKRIGRFELSHQGTIFLDEIAELSVEMQSKLLHFLDNKIFERVGESTSLSVDARIIAATNVDVHRAMDEGRLRGDFYYRLSACTLEMPPLRQRLDDLPALSAYFINQLGALHGLPKITLPAAVLRRMQQHNWPGNIRELRNVISALLVQNSIAGELREKDIEQAFREDSQRYSPPALASPRAQTDLISPHPSLDRGPATMQDVERRHILEVLRDTNWVISGANGAANLLGLPRSTLQHRMRKLGISRKGASGQ